MAPVEFDFGAVSVTASSPNVFAISSKAVRVGAATPTFTLYVALAPTQSSLEGCVAVIVTEPPDLMVARPAEVTVRTFGSDDV